jgi:hypothetical protein
MSDQTPTPSRLWKRMTPEQRLHAARAFWVDEQAAQDQLQAVLLISQQKKFRPKTVVALDAERKAKHLASLTALPEALAARALVVYHLAEQRPMMGVFLDALGISHEDGLIKEDQVAPDPEKLGSAVAALTERFAADVVSLYLNTLVCQDPATWGPLAEHVRRLPAGG